MQTSETSDCGGEGRFYAQAISSRQKYSLKDILNTHSELLDDHCINQEKLPRRAAGPRVPPLPEDHPQRHQTKQPTQVPLSTILLVE